LGEWQIALTNSPSEAHGVLDTVLADRIRFAPDPEHRGYTLTLPVAFDRVLSCVLANSAGLPVMLASLTPPSWNQVAGFLESMRQLRDSARVAA